MESLSSKRCSRQRESGQRSLAMIGQVRSSSGSLASIMGSRSTSLRTITSWYLTLIGAICSKKKDQLMIEWKAIKILWVIAEECHLSTQIKRVKVVTSMELKATNHLLGLLNLSGAILKVWDLENYQTTVFKSWRILIIHRPESKFNLKKTQLRKISITNTALKRKLMNPISKSSITSRLTWGQLTNKTCLKKMLTKKDFQTIISQIW